MSRVETSRAVEPAQLAEEIRRAKKLMTRPDVAWHEGEGWVEANLPEGELRRFLDVHQPDPEYHHPEWKKRLRDLLRRGAPLSAVEKQEKVVLVDQMIQHLLERDGLLP